MPIQLVIHPFDNRPDAAFAPGEVRTFEGDRVRIGGTPDCDCRLPRLPGQPAELAALVRDPQTHDWTLLPGRGSQLLVDEVAASAPVLLKSGDRIRCADHVLVFHKAYPRAKHSRWADSLSVFAKIMLAFILVGELLAVAWLPQRVNQSARWEQQIARNRTTYLLDQLRAENDQIKPRSDLEGASRRFLAGQLNTLALYLRRNQDVLGRDQWRRMQNDIEIYQKIMDHLRRGTALGTLPRLEAAAAFNAVRTKSVTERQNP